MYNQMSSAISAKEIQAKQKELEMQPKIQIQELQKQSVILEDSNQITIENAKVVEEILNCTKQNQESSNRQFKASLIISSTALLIAIFSFIVSLIQLFK